MPYGYGLFDNTFFDLETGRLCLKESIQYQFIGKLYKPICEQFFDAVYASGITNQDRFNDSIMICNIIQNPTKIIEFK